MILMKKLSLYIFLVLMWCNVGFAEKKDLMDIKIGESITKHFSTYFIIENYLDDDVEEEDIRVYGKNYQYSLIGFVNDGTFKDYDYIQVYYETKTDKIVSTSGIYETSDESDCISKRNKLASEYQKKNRITSLFAKDEDTHKFPDGQVDRYIVFENKKKQFIFRCYIYPDGVIHNRVTLSDSEFSAYVFEKFNQQWIKNPRNFRSEGSNFV